MGLTKVASRRGAVPIGGIIPHYNFGIAGLFDTDTWKYCDGTSIVDGDSPLNGQTMPDLSGRYLVGFGSDSVPASMNAAGGLSQVGAIGHLVSLAHVHAGGSHTHGAGSLQFPIFYVSSANLFAWEQNGSSHQVYSNTVFNNGIASGVYMSDTSARTYYTQINAGSGITAPDGTAATGTGGSATQSIQPRSVQVRYLMRIK